MIVATMANWKNCDINNGIQTCRTIQILTKSLKVYCINL